MHENLNENLNKKPFLYKFSENINFKFCEFAASSDPFKSAFAIVFLVAYLL